MDAEIRSDLLSDAELIERVDQWLKAFLRLPMAESLRDAIDYSIFSGGKRIRPLLCLHACQAVGGEVDQALPAACAIELIHTFSLVHDDLPAMDDDDFRRGRPTLHKHTNEAMAVLAGDSMVTLAFGMMTGAVKEPDLCVTLIEHLANATQKMITGQVYDTMGGMPEIGEPFDRLKEIHKHKTGALIDASVCMGALSGGAQAEQVACMASYAEAIGLMFQAVDDLLDVTQTAEKMGKATGKDAEQGKLTYPGLLGIDGTRAEIDKLLTQALNALSGFDAKADPLRAMAKQLAARER